MILIVSSPEDGHATTVASRLRAKGAQPKLLDLSEFPREGSVSIEFDGLDNTRRRFTTGSQEIDFSECNVVWWRRPQPFEIHDEIQPGTDWNFAYSECQAAVSGMWLTLPCFWINHPTRDEEAARKVYQLKVARDVGLSIPRTCITSDPTAARAFVTACGADQAICKAFSGTERAWRETRVVTDDEIEFFDRVKYAPVIFQELVPAEADLRITVIGDRVFACAIDTSRTDYKVDFRMVMDQANMEAFELPETVLGQLLEFMRRMDLVYGAVDMRLSPNGKYTFLEINPSGQWLFVEQRTGLPITEALADLMIKKDGKLATA